MSIQKHTGFVVATAVFFALGWTTIGGEAPLPVSREVVIPAGTVLSVRLDTSVGSDISRVEQPVSAHLSRALVIDGVTVAPAGSAVKGNITSVRRPGKVKGRGYVGIRFNSLFVGDQRYSMTTRANGWTAPSAKKKDARNIAVPAGAGAIVGAVVDGKKGAAIGAAAGGGAGTAYVLSTRGPEVRLGRNTAVSVRLAEPLRVRVRGS